MTENNQDWTASEAADKAEDAMAADGPVRVSGAVWTDATAELHDLQRRAENLRRLFGDAAREVEE